MQNNVADGLSNLSWACICGDVLGLEKLPEETALVLTLCVCSDGLEQLQSERQLVDRIVVRSWISRHTDLVANIGSNTRITIGLHVESHLLIQLASVIRRAFVEFGVVTQIVRHDVDSACIAALAHKIERIGVPLFRQWMERI